jgi:hypothetical protein
MRFVSLILLAPLLAACQGLCTEPTAEPVMEIKSPIWFRSQPVMKPQGFAIAAPAAACQAPQMQALQTYTVEAPKYRYAQAAMPSACVPQQPFSPPPVPGDDGIPDSVPAVK